MTMVANHSAVQPIPAGFHTITPALVVAGAAEAIDFYVRALGAVELDRSSGPDGRILHATIRVGSSNVMVNDEFPEFGSFGPGKYGGGPVSMHLYVEDADAVYERALAAGATVVMPISDVFWGDRYARIKDPFGHEWGIATHLRDVDEAELARAAESCGMPDPDGSAPS